MEDPNEWNKDKRTRERIKKCNEQVGDWVDLVLGDKSYTKRNWVRKTELVKSSMERIKDPQFLLEKLNSIVMENKSSTLDVKKAVSALQELELIFHQSNDLVPNQEDATEIHDSILQNQNGGLQIKAQALKEAKEESHSLLEELKQIRDLVEQKQQTIEEATIYTNVASMLHKAGNSCLNISILKQVCPTQVQGRHGVEINEGQLRLSFPKNPNCILINEKGKSAEISNQETNALKKQENEVILPFQLVEGRLAELKLAMKEIDQEMMCLPAENNGNYWDLESFVAPELMSLLRDVTVQSNKQSYKVHPDNAELLKEIFQKHPEIDKNFQVAHPDFQSNFMDSLVEIYRKIKECKLEMLEMKDIESMYLKIQDMEKNSLQVRWLKERLEKAWNRLEREKKRRKIQERIKKDEEALAERIKKAEEELAELDEEDS